MYELPYDLNEDDDLPTLVLKAIGERPTSLVELPGAGVAGVHLATLPDGVRVVVKHDPHPGARLDLEAEMLRALRLPDVIRVPDVLSASSHLLVLEDMPGEPIGPAAHADAGEQLARLHAVTAPEAGLGSDTLWEGIVLPSPWTPSWPEFYRKKRLDVAAALAREAGLLSPGLAARIDRLCDALGDILRESAACSLLHGHLDQTTILATAGRVTAFTSPSTLFGDPEFDLAYASLFGNFGDHDSPFFRAYTAVRPLGDAFWRVRRYVYAIFPALMLLALCGERHTQVLDDMLARAGFP